MRKQSGAKLNRIKPEWQEGEKRKKQTKKKRIKELRTAARLVKISFFKCFFLTVVVCSVLFCVVFFFVAATVARVSGGSEWERLVCRLARLFAVHLQLETAQRDKRSRRRLSSRHKSPFSDSAPNCFFFSLCDAWQKKR